MVNVEELKKKLADYPMVVYFLEDFTYVLFEISEFLPDDEGFTIKGTSKSCDRNDDLRYSWKDIEKYVTYENGRTIISFFVDLEGTEITHPDYHHKHMVIFLYE